jgi:Leucine-rich repeat (LRR) protein
VAHSQKGGNQEICETINELGELKLKPKTKLKLEDICQCGDVVALELRKRNLVKLPNCFETLVELRRLDLKKSTLSGFPKILLSLSWLEELSLASTNVTYLPNNLYEMQSLRKLDLQGTTIKILPDGLEHIEVIDFRMCELTREEQVALREQYPQTIFYLPSPCNCP